MSKHIDRLAHVCLSATDLEATERFYCEGLGFRKVFSFLKDGKTIGFYLEVTGRTYVEVFQAGSVPPDQSPIRHVCFETASVDDLTAHLRGSGYEVSDKKLGADQSWQAWVNDPSGVRIELHEYTPESSQVTGRDCVLR